MCTLANNGGPCLIEHPLARNGVIAGTGGTAFDAWLYICVLAGQWLEGWDSMCRHVWWTSHDRSLSARRNGLNHRLLVG